MAINTEQVSFVINSYFTDETKTLSVEWAGLASFPTASNPNGSLPQEISFGMSTKAPDVFTEDSMEIPFEKIDPYLADGTSYYLTYAWDITKYQSNLRSVLLAYKTTEIYVYAKAIGYDNYEYINWHLCYVSIADANAVPIFTAEPSYTVTDTLSTGLTGNSTTVIRYVSDVKASFGCEARKESLLKSATVKIGSQTSSIAYTNVSTANSSVNMSDIDGEVFNVTILDSRGFRTMHSVAVEKYIKYFYPTCNLVITNPSAGGRTTTVTADGLCFNGSFGSKANTISVQYRYKEGNSGYTSWKTMTVTRNGDAYTATATVYDLSYKAKYYFQARIVDQITTVETVESIAKTKPVFDWGEDDFRFNVPVNIEGDLTVNGAIDMTGELAVGDLRVGFLTMESPLLAYATDDGFENLINLEQLSVDSGVWVPKCNACTAPDVAIGHYARVGDVCIISFYFQGVTNKFLGDSYIYFSGLPYEANHNTVRWYSGGGNFSGYMKKDNMATFSGWNIENNLIYARLNLPGGSSDTKTLSYNGTYQSFSFSWDGGSKYAVAGFSGQQIYCSGTIAYGIA